MIPSSDDPATTRLASRFANCIRGFQLGGIGSVLLHHFGPVLSHADLNSSMEAFTS
jgi:hypothetical protein